MSHDGETHFDVDVELEEGFITSTLVLAFRALGDEAHLTFELRGNQRSSSRKSSYVPGQTAGSSPLDQAAA